MGKLYKRKDCYIHRKVAGSDVLISVGENIANFNGYIELNASAAFLWDKLNDFCSLNHLETAMAEQFGIEMEQASADVHEFVKELEEQKMVEVVSEEEDHE